MSQFRAFSSDIEVKGELLKPVVEGMGVYRRKALQILLANGISDLSSERWYSQQSWLDALEEIVDIIGHEYLYVVGQKAQERAELPPDVNTIEKGLSAIDRVYRENHRGGEAGAYEFHNIGSTSAKVICRNPNPCHYDKGIIEAMATRLKPNCTLPIVEHDENEPCRAKGDESCTYQIFW